jgi:co-chaperonin GroES (HSP10)
MKNEIMPLFNNIMILPYEENPYRIKETKEGLTLTDGTFENPDTGELDEKDFYIECGHVIAVGPECKYIHEGDDVFYDCRTIRPVPFLNKGFLHMNEQGVVAVMNNDLEERFKK